MRPAKDQRYRSRRDVEVAGLVHLRAPATGDFKSTLPMGEEVVVVYDPPSHAKAVYAIPKRYEDLERVLVPPGERSSPIYNGYSLVIWFEQLEHDFELVGKGAA